MFERINGKTCLFSTLNGLKSNENHMCCSSTDSFGPAEKKIHVQIQIKIINYCMYMYVYIYSESVHGSCRYMYMYICLETNLKMRQ